MAVVPWWYEVACPGQEQPGRFKTWTAQGSHCYSLPCAVHKYALGISLVKILGEDGSLPGDGTIPPDDGYPNGDAPPTDDVPGWDSVLGAPDYAQLITQRQSRKAREYTVKVNSVLKALTLASANAGDLPDAAAILHYGPPWSHALGQLADQNDSVAKAIDVLTSPSSPAVMVAVTSISFISQILRNHERQLAEIPNARKRAKTERKARKQTGEKAPPRFTIKVGRWTVPVRFNFKPGRILAGFRTQTKEPDKLAYDVFSNEDVRKALEKAGIKLVPRGE